MRGIPLRLWRLVTLARHRLLMMDYDGTLAPFHAVRDLAYPLQRAVQILRAIAAGAGTKVAIVTGRPLAEIDRLLGPLPVTIDGEDGWEERRPGGEIVHRDLPWPVNAILDRAQRAAVTRGWGRYLERKRSGLVLHTRGMAAPEARSVQEDCFSLWAGYCREAPVHLSRVNGGLELTPHGGGKGAAVSSLILEAPYGTIPVFVGDDVTDEDAFRVVGDWGFGVRVGPDERLSLAAGHLPSCDAVADFLAEWLRLTGSSAHQAQYPAGR